jgi:hypothetical protein
MKTLAALLLAGILLYGCTGQGNGNIDYDAFAKCLTAKGAKMYGAYWCGHCQNQKAAFGEAWQYVKYVECAGEDGGQAVACAGAGVTSYPTWIFANGSRQTGELSFEELSASTGCELKQKG